MKIKNLLEASSSFYLRKGGDFAATLIKGSNRNTPSFSIIAADSQPLASSSNLLFIKINSTKFKNLNWTANSYGRTSAEMLEMGNFILNVIGRPKDLEAPVVMDQFLKNLEKHKTWIENFGAFKITKFNNISDLNKMLVLKLDISPEVIFKITGVHVDDTVSGSHNIGQTEIVFPDNMRQARIDDITKLIEVANGIVERSGLGVLTKCKMFVAPITGTTIGLYYPETKQIKIDPSAKATKSALHTLLHEYSHKYFYEQLSQEQRNAVKLKFDEIYRNKNLRIVSPEKAQQLTQQLMLIKSALANVKIGDVVEYIGRKKSIKQFSPYTITELSNDRLRMVSTMTQFRALSGKPSQFVNADFAINGVKLETPKAPENPQEEIDSGWFPSQYSRKDYHEWWAEIMAFYLEGRIKDQEVKDFINTTLQG